MSSVGTPVTFTFTHAVFFFLFFPVTVTLIFVVPAAFALILPLFETVATFLFPDTYLIDFFALLGVTTTLILDDLPTARLIVFFVTFFFPCLITTFLIAVGAACAVTVVIGIAVNTIAIASTLISILLKMLVLFIFSPFFFALFSDPLQQDLYRQSPSARLPLSWYLCIKCIKNSMLYSRTVCMLFIIKPDRSEFHNLSDLCLISYIIYFPYVIPHIYHYPCTKLTF